MTYKYKYIPASMAVTLKKDGTPKKDYIELFQQTLRENFYNSSTWWTIKEQVSNGSDKYEDFDVRIAHVIDAETGLKLGDDWKTLLFREIDHVVELGKLYDFDDNIWLTVNTEYIKNLTGTCTVRRCNNTMRWIDEETGAYYVEPCAIDYLVKEPRNYATAGSPFMTPGGFLHIMMQFNPTSNKIHQNQRFLFGNTGHWTCYKVIGTGLNDFKNMQTYNNNSAKVLTIDLVADFVDEQLDDVVNGIANANRNLYSISLNQSEIQGKAGDTIQLSTSITYNGSSTVRTVSWESSNENIASVDNNGLVTLKTIGNCTITASVKDNPSYDTCSVIVTDTPTDNVEIIISPDTNYILEGSQRTYSAYLYVNGVQQSDTFTFTCNQNDVPSVNYAFQQIDGNHFMIDNYLRDVMSYLTVLCVSGMNTKAFNISLRGAW